MSNIEVFRNSRNINYYNKDFSLLREDLINYAKTYFPHSGNDFTTASPGLMFIEMASYVGDLLSFYIDKQVQETYLQTATERENIIQLANLLGYNHKNTAASTVTLTCFQLLPRDSRYSYDSPDFRYALRVDEGSIIKTNTDAAVSFRTLSNVDFKVSSSHDTEISVYESDLATGKPIYYLIKKKVKASSGILETETFSFGADTPPNVSVKINKTNVIDILDITDSNGNVWYEVPYLAQQTILEGIKNDSLSSDLSEFAGETPYLLNYLVTNKKFIKRLNTDNTTEIIFGSGVSSTADNILVPNQENINSSFETANINNRNIDPSNFLYLQANGEVPKNITLTVRYYYGGGFETNVSQGAITNTYQLSFGEINESGLSAPLLKTVKNSVYFINEEPSSGGRGEETDEEIRQNAVAYFNAQNRCVTALDYSVRSLVLPAKYGSLAKVYAKRDSNISTENSKVENPLAINLYCLSYNSSRNFTKLNLATKTNLQKYLDFYRMATDALNIKDAYIINIGVKFSIVVLKGHNLNETLLRCIIRLKKFFENDNMQINKPIIHSEVFTELSLVKGVQSVVNLTFENKFSISAGYSGVVYDINNATRGEILYPSVDASIFEVKFPDTDIEGIIVNY